MEVDSLINRLNNIVVPALNATFTYIATQAPNARVFVVGYPTVSPGFADVPPGGCFTPMGTGADTINPPFTPNSFPFTDVDTLYLHHIENEIDNAIETAAHGHGFTFLPTWDATATHSACSKTDPYIYGVTLNNTGGETTPVQRALRVVRRRAPEPEGHRVLRDHRRRRNPRPPRLRGGRA